MATTVERKERRRATYGGEQGLGARRRPSRSASEYSTKNLHDIVFDEKENDPTLPDSSLWHDGPLFVAILPCLAAFVFGTEYIQDVILFLFVGWYLHTCIRMPWSLYELSRPRPMHKRVRANMTPEQIAAEASLQMRSLIFLFIAFVSPFAGLFLIRRILQSVGAADNGPYITYFHGALFVLFGGVRPINHLLALLAGGTRELQSRVHYPPVEDPEEEELKLKLERMEIIVSMLTEKFKEIETAKIEDGVKKQHNMLEVQDTFEKTAARLEDGARRREKKSEMALEAIDRRVEGLEKQYEALLSLSMKEAEASRPPNGTLRALVVSLLDWIDAFWNSWRPRSSRSRRAYAYATNPRYESRRYSAGGNGAIIGGRGLTPLHRRTYDGSSQNLDTVLEEEGHEFESKGDPAVPRDVPGVDLPHSIPESLEVNNGDDTTVLGRNTWRRNRVPGALDSQSGHSPTSSVNGSTSQFAKSPTDGSQNTKRRQTQPKEKVNGQES